MADYFPGRKLIKEAFWVALESKREKVQCAIFETWKFRESGTAYCGLPGNVKVSKSSGISKATSTTLKSTIETSIGPLGLLQLKHSIETTTGYETRWDVSETKEGSFDINPPKCGRSTITIYELVREYELAIYRRGHRPFRHNVWDFVFADTIPEDTGAYAGVPTSVDWDEKCKCETKPLPPEDFQGRISLNFGRVSLLVPFELTVKDLKIRIERIGMTFPVLNFARALSELDGAGLVLTFDESVIPPMFRFLGDLKGKEIRAKARIYSDAGTGRGLEAFGSEAFGIQPSEDIIGPLRKREPQKS